MTDSNLSPRWMHALVGWWTTLAVLAWIPLGPGPVAPPLCLLSVDRPGLWAGSPGPRELRGLEGIGLRRGLRLSRALWVDPSLARAPERLRGIGPVTAAPLVDHLSRRPAP